ncbi:MAG: copper homeostasis periplasmic binding protein CopC, partial [Betaproteobacteria bacterium]
AVTAALALSATSAFAHAHLETSMPVANATVSPPLMIMLHFTEALEPRFSGFEITDARGHAVNAPSHADPSNAAVLMATPTPALAPGVYHVNWHIVAHDGHRMRGTFDFTVRA